ncbi:GH1 family beta-glucosidase [Dactylosporangium sp. CA-052675]|uniref:GH1 family beta-glucosidase n=1 Tax=Dactylosporangium sp. CA-052675 TaxID=3239927 RepID=UPI003D92D43A
MTVDTFPPGFLWGAATSAYQVEGAVDADGRGPSIWDTFAARPEHIADGSTGAEACDHYHRYPDDLDLARRIGITAYRFSVAWPRVLPDGRTLNPRGLDHYRRVAEACLRRGITPMVTCYHWDLPQPLQDRGGWADRDTAERFADYAATVHDALGDLVPWWVTVNEPAVAAWAGHSAGVHAPGVRDTGRALAAAHHLLLGHGLATTRLRAGRHPDTRVGIALNLTVAVPATDAAEDVAAAARFDGHHNRMFLDPILTGAYPRDMLDWYAPQADLTHLRDGDLQTIAAPLDLLGVNFYNRTHVRADPSAATGNPALGVAEVRPDGLAYTEMGWPVEPDGLRQVLCGLRDRYPGLPPVHITENGAAFPDVPGPDGTVDDRDRVGYLDGHLRALHAAIAAGVDVRGYFAWSLLDNFEWAMGYTKRFGLIAVDYPTQRRTLKSSATWYARVIAANALPAPDEGKM